MQKNKKRIAIMTWYTYRNYGSVLQASAMSYVIEQLGYVPFLIHYAPKGGIEEQTKITLRWLAKKVKEKIKRVRNGEIVSEERENLFETYLNKKIKETPLCRSYSELYELNDEYDAFVCGSDQIWSPLCYDDKYYLSFVQDSRKVVAYAPSFGVTEIKNPFIRESIIQQIVKFQHLSVREKQGALLIKQLTGKNANVVLDPTLLMNTLDWDLYAEVGKSGCKLSNEYMLCYFLGDSEKYMKYVQRLSKIMNVPFFVIPLTKKQRDSGYAVPFEVGPNEFVNLVRNAKYVCTDSFHGMAFAINYNVPFSAFKRFANNDSQNQNSRILSLLKMLNLENRLVDYTDMKCLPEQLLCDFTKANILLNIERERSMEYLKSALNEATNSTFDNIVNSSYKIANMCCGCGACAAICPKNAVSVSRNREGFEQYFIDQGSCIQCGQCKSVCPMIKVVAPDIKNAIGLYSVKSTSKQVLERSSSGGIGYELAKMFQSQGKYVCGCMYDSAVNMAKHIMVAPDEPEKLLLLQGSKYIQSVCSQAMEQVYEIAKTKQVIFFGTPCQVAAVDKLLCKKSLREKVFLVDLICHGVPSQHLWEKYLNDVDQNYGTGKNPSIIFRSKERGWRRRMLVVSGNGHIYKREEKKDDFYAFFRRGLCYLESCSDCPYRERSAADLRIGDYWGNRFENDKQGVSMVMVNTLAGEKVLGALVENRVCDIQEQKKSEYWTVQYPYNPQRPFVREKLIDDLKNSEKSLNELRKEYCSYYDQVEKIRKVKTTVNKILKRG